MEERAQQEMVNTNTLTSEEKQKLEKYQQMKDDYKDKSRYITLNTITPVITNLESFKINNEQVEETKEATQLFKDFGKKKSINTKMIPSCIMYSCKGTITYSSNKSGYILIYSRYRYKINKENYSFNMLVKYLKKKASINQLKLNNITITTPNYEEILKSTIEGLEDNNPPVWWIPYQSYLIDYRGYLIDQNQYNYTEDKDSPQIVFDIDVLEKIISTKKNGGIINYYVKPKLPFNSSIYIPFKWELIIEARDIQEYQINNVLKSMSCAQAYLWMQNKMIKSYQIMKKEYIKFDNKSLINGTTAATELKKYNTRREQLLNSDTSEYTSYDKIINKKDLSKFRTNSIKYLKKPIRIGGDKWGNVSVKLLVPGAKKQKFKKKTAFLYKNKTIIEEQRNPKNFELIVIKVQKSELETNRYKYPINEYSFIGIKPINEGILTQKDIIKYNLYSIYFDFLMEIEKEEIEDLFEFQASISVYLNSLGNYKKLENESEAQYKKRTTMKKRMTAAETIQFANDLNSFEKEPDSNTLLGSQIFTISEFNKNGSMPSNIYVAKATIVASLKSCVVKNVDTLTILVDTNCNARIKINSYIKYKLFQSYFEIATEDSHIRIPRPITDPNLNNLMNEEDN